MSRTTLIPSLVIAIALAGCSGQDADGGTAPPVSPTQVDVSQSADPTASAASSVEASEAPSPSGGSSTSDGLPSGPYAWNQLLSVTADGLAVRRGPTTSAELAFGAHWDAATGNWVGTSDEVRLDAGYQVRVSLGPVARDGFDWYEVTNTVEPGAESDVIQWDVDNDGVYADSGWIAAAEGETLFVEPAPDSAEVPNPPLEFAAGSSGSFLSAPFQAAGDIGGTWVLVTDELAPCEFTVTLEPSGEALVDFSLIGVYEYGAHGAAQLPAGEYRLRVTAGVDGHPEAACPWSLVLFQSVS